MRFNAMYRCRLCGEIYSPCFTGKNIALRTSIVHLCKDGNFGLADFVGWENKVGEDDSSIGGT